MSKYELTITADSAKELQEIANAIRQVKNDPISARSNMETRHSKMKRIEDAKLSTATDPEIDYNGGSYE